MYLNCHTYYSLNYGTFSEISLLELAHSHDLDTLALTDINNTSACLNFVRKAKDYKIKPVLGIDFRNGADQQYVGLARNNQGFQQLNEFLSHFLHDQKPIPSCAPALSEVFIIYPFEKVLQLEKTSFKENEFIGISIEELRKIRFTKYIDEIEKIVLLQPVSLRNKRDYNTHRLLRAIGLNTLLSKLPASEEASIKDMMSPLADLWKAFEGFEFILENTQKLLDQCSIEFEFGNERSSQNKQGFLKSPEEDFELLQQLCIKGLPKRYARLTPEIHQRLEKELKVIKEMNFVTYFLINHDIVEYARRNNYPHVGRGSGANSIVAYIIGITDVDPIELDLYFERFINPYRVSPPDFDIDFSTWERDDVTAYIFKKYDNVALLATYNTFKYKSAIRELGKVFGMPKEEIDKLTQGHLSDLDSIASLVLKYAGWIKDFPNHLSVHSAGVLILEKPIHYYSSTFFPPKGFPTVQFDMIIAEDVGIFKFDILGQRGLAKIKEATQIIRSNQPNAPLLDIRDVEAMKKDPNLNRLLREGKATGVYYVESPAMRGLMTKLKTSSYLELVAASSVIRPGVSSSGMKNEFIKRTRDPRERKKANPALWKIMPETYGIMVYQEDVLKVAHLFAGLDLGEADVLRRGMSGKFRSRAEFQAVEDKYFQNCKERGYSENLAREIWEQIRSFAGYAFAKGHSASYAVESYQSLYLKCYFPLEFMVAVLNNGGGFYDTETYVHEARMLGAKIESPCINNSDHPNLIIGKTIFLGLGYLKSLESLVIQRILNERQLHGPYTSFDDFIDRVAISLEQLTILIRIEAFRFTGISKKELMWQAVFKTKSSKVSTHQDQLFKPEHKKFSIPNLPSNEIENAYDQIELIGFPLSGYFNLMDGDISSRIKAKDFPHLRGQTILIFGGLVHTGLNKTSKGEIMRFSTFFDQQGDFFDCVHFPQAYKKSQVFGKGVYACFGKVTEEFGFFSLEIIWVKKKALKPDPRYESEYKVRMN